MNNDFYKTLLKNKDLMEDILPEDEKVDFLSTGVLSLNLLFSGKVDGGIPIGKMSQMAAPSTLGKSFVGLSILKNAQKKGMYTIVLDTERSFDFEWAKKIGIKTSSEHLLVIQLNSIETIQQRILEILKGLSREEKKQIFFLIDSFGGLITSKTYNDATIGKDVADMTIPKKKNSFSKLLLETGATYFIINHVYDAIISFGDPLAIPGGRGLHFVCTCTVLGSSKAKDKNSQQEIQGTIITCKTFKSRYGKEQSKLKFRIKHNGGLDVFYGLLNDALEGEFVSAPTKGFLQRNNVKDDKKWREKDIYTSEWWLPIFKDTDFKKFLEDKYSFRNQQIDVADFDVVEELKSTKKKK
jgi:recombination protein RecA